MLAAAAAVPVPIAAGTVGLLLGPVGRRQRLTAVGSAVEGVGAHVVYYALQERREGGHLAGAEEGEGVGLDGGRPVAVVGVERV